mmetsp:Transcript_100292/g.189171  ORF Transcript_100292/g.189171 Transcript_100292/m.189171 type:complete len:468 (-) Transcript_100292:102-1505(-)
MQEFVFERIVTLGQKRQELLDASSTPVELQPLSKADLEELRHMARPPQAARECLEVVYATLHVEEMSKQLQRTAPDTRIVIEWRKIMLMVSRFETFFPAMQRFDIAPLVAAPRVTEYLSRVYFGDKGLTKERVSHCSKACVSLFRWCSRSLKRVEAAVELLSLDAELAELQGQVHPRWRCETDGGWLEYPPSIDSRINAAEESGSLVVVDIDGVQYEIDVEQRTQRNLSSGFARPVRPPGNSLDLRALQGFWRCPERNHLIRVSGDRVTVNGQQAEAPLEPNPGGGFRWESCGWMASGSPTEVTWTLPGEEATWLPVAAVEVPPEQKPSVAEQVQKAMTALSESIQNSVAHQPLESPKPSAQTVQRQPPESPQPSVQTVQRQEVLQKLPVLVRPRSPPRWRCRTERGWVKYPPEIDRLICQAKANGQATLAFKLHFDRYELDFAKGVQRNLFTRFERPVQPPTREGP